MLAALGMSALREGIAVRTPTRQGCDPFLRNVGLILLGCGLVVAVAPQPRTVNALVLALAVVFLALIVRREWRAHRLILHHDDGTLPHMAYIVFTGIVAIPLAALLIAQLLFGAFSPPVTGACLCPRVSGLVTAGGFGIIIVFFAFMTAGCLIVIAGAAARVRFEIRRRRVPGADEEAPER